ncbi:hypothetical protein [Mycobacteroides chelonae]|uniref:hypothetical protein n=1 Tax=Mycobacteroides chelonae TaxID=1774 RepID=UPI00104246D0|nr:hypothetical protein [Mycobacteroides chelonae]
MGVRKYVDASGLEQTAVDGPKGTVLVTKGKLEHRYKVWFSDSLGTLLSTENYDNAVTAAKKHAGLGS